MMQIATTSTSVKLDLTHKFTSRFAPFVMSDEENAGTEEDWIGYHCLILAWQEAREELKNFGSYRNELRELLRETGFHEIARLRKQTDLLLFTDEEFDTVLDRLADTGFHEIALKAEAVRERQRQTTRGRAPMASTLAKRQLIAKLESLAESNRPNEAASALRKIEEIKIKYEIKPDLLCFDLEELDAPLQLTPSAELVIALNKVWSRLKALGDIHYGLEEEPEQMHRRLVERTHQLNKLVHEHALLKRSKKPLVEKRR